MANKATIMSGINDRFNNVDNNGQVLNSDIRKYSLFAGGLDMTHASSAVYDPLVTGYGRIFMVRKPVFLVKDYGEELNVFKHILEYGNTGVSGIGDISVEDDTLKGGYAGKEAGIVTGAKDNTNSFTIKTYEFSGSPLRAILHLWVTGVADLNSGLATYHGSDIPVLNANHTAEFIYTVSDRSGTKPEYACMFANCFPKTVPESHFEYDAGTHNLVQLNIEFSCVKYESLAINYYAAKLLNKFKLLSNHLNFNPGLADAQASGIVSQIANPNVPDEKIASTGIINENYGTTSAYLSEL